MSAADTARQAWHAVKGDGCTAAPDFTFGECCRRHDADYTLHHDEDGRALTRAQADRRLRDCIAREAATPIGRRVISWAYWIGTRLFGRGHWTERENGNA